MLNSKSARRWGGVAASVAAALGGPAELPAQAGEPVTVSAGAHYRAGALKRLLLGDDYRDLWVAPVRVPVLDLGRYAGGLTPLARGGGKQTISLRFRAGDGREYNFRSVDKDQTGGLHPDFQETFVDEVAQDQVHSKHPAAGLISHVILDAAGVLHPHPELFVMPDDPRLGEFRQTFAGMLGTIEVHPNEGANGGEGFAGAGPVVGTESLLEKLEETPDHRVDDRAFLRARLVDLVLGDWDRHVGQWRWAGYERGAATRWVPVPEDRDNAFSDYDGLLLRFLRSRATNLVKFDATYPNLFGLTANAQPLDRPLLSGLQAPVFDSMAVELQARLTDAAIADAVRQGPAEYQRLRAAELETKLRARRDALPEVTRRFYRYLAREVEVHATDQPEIAEVDRMADGSARVRLYDARGTGRSAAPFYDRTFFPTETREVRVYLQGGDDRAVLRGSSPASLLVRVMGGGGDDVLVDSSVVAGGRARTAFYDDRGDNRFTSVGRTVVDERPFIAEPDSAPGGFNDNRPATRDWGREAQWFVPSFGWSYNTGPVIGGGPVFTRYGFRRVPFATQLAVRGLYAPTAGRVGVDLAARVQRTNSLSHVTVGAQATRLHVTRFHGFGNETPRGDSSEPYKVWGTDFRLEPVYHHAFSREVELFAGPVAQHHRPELPAGGPAELERPVGSEAYSLVGGQVGGEVDTRDLRTFPRRGVRARLRASAFPELGGVGGFAALDAVAATYLPVPLPLETTLALRAGGRRVGGEFPIQHAAFLGGPGSVRGFAQQRYAGEAVVHGGAEIRTFLTRVNFISRGDLGVIGLAEAGRVFAEGESSSRWHRGFGGGFWVGILDRTRTFSLVYARGEHGSVYFDFGMPF